MNVCKLSTVKMETLESENIGKFVIIIHYKNVALSLIYIYHNCDNSHNYIVTH